MGLKGEYPPLGEEAGGGSPLPDDLSTPQYLGESQLEREVYRRQQRKVMMLVGGVVVVFVTAFALFILVPGANPLNLIASLRDPGGGLPGAELVTLDELEAQMRPGGADYPQEGQPPPDFEFVDLEGRGGVLSAFKGKRVLVNLWGTWCPPCREEMPMFARMYRQEGGGEFFEIIAVADSRSPEEEVRRMRDSVGMDFIITIDSDDDVFRAYRVRGVPTSVIINREGVVERIVVGAMNEDTFRRVVLGPLR